MFKIVSAREAVDLINDGDCIAINSFLALCNPEALHDALYERFIETGKPRGLRMFCAAAFGVWDENRCAERYIRAGAVREVIAGHYASMPVTTKMALEGKIESYCLPLGVLSHTIRDAAAGRDWHLSEVGVGIYCDPRIDTYALNDVSKKELVSARNIEGKEYLLYKTPKIDIAFIKGTTVDPNGNISFERECLTVDALAMAQAAKRNGGKVIVQVERVSHVFARPRNVIVPGLLVDMVVVCETAIDLGEYNPALSGDIHVPASHMDFYISRLSAAKSRKSDTIDQTADIIGERAARELQPGHIVNIGIGIPETVGKYASKKSILKDIHITVEAGGVGGLPAPGEAFGATIGADMVCDMAAQFDFYDGGGLDICFLGGLEVDAQGNVNAHKLEGGYSGIGGFANITHATKTIVFCMSFNTKGLVAVKESGVDSRMIKKDKSDGASNANGGNINDDNNGDGSNGGDNTNGGGNSNDDNNSGGNANGDNGAQYKNYEQVCIKREGSIPKFKKEISAISFNGKNALKRGQRILYVTERCVFELTPKGLALKEAYPGIDEQKQIRDMLDFEC